MMKRRQGEFWDVLPAQIGIVKHVNTERQITTVALAKKSICLVHHDDLPAVTDFQVGDLIAMRSRRDRRKGQLVPLTIEQTDECPSADFVRSFSGSLQEQDAHRGLSVNNIHVPNALLEESQLLAGNEVQGVALCEWNVRKNDSDWVAISIQSREG
jgi:hypothetical protein